MAGVCLQIYMVNNLTREQREMAKPCYSFAGPTLQPARPQNLNFRAGVFFLSSVAELACGCYSPDV